MIKNLIIIFSMLIQSIVYGQEFSKTQQPYIPVNYIKNAGVESGITGYALYNDGDVAVPVDGFSGTPTITMTSSTTNPLAGSRSLVISKPSGVSHRGQGFATEPFTIENKAKGKVIRTLVDYEVVSGTYATGDMAIWVYDITNARMIQPSAYLIENSGLKETKFVEWQSSIDSNSYRLIYHITSTSTAAYSLRFDSFEAGLGPKVYGSTTTGWKEFTPSFSGLGTVTSIKAFWRRSGENLEVYGRATSGTPTASGAGINFSSLGLAIDTSKVIADGTNGQIAGVFTRQAVDATFFNIGYNSNEGSFVYIADTAAQGGLRDTDGNAILGTGEKFSFKFSVPIKGWTTTQQLSNDADTRVVAASYVRNSSQSINASSDTTLIANVKNIDTHGAYNTSNGRYYCISSGVYNVSASVFLSVSTATGVRQLRLIKRNSSGGVTEDRYLDTLNKTNTNNEEISLRLTSKIQCNMGESLEIVAWTNASGISTISGILFMDFEKLSGPSQIAASESVSARYTQSSGQSIPTSSPTVVDFNTKVYDSHNAVTTGSSWRFTAPISGEYSVVSTILFASSAWPIQRYSVIYLRKNGVNYAATPDVVTQVAQSMYFGPYPLTTKVKLLQGEYIDIVLEQNRGSATSMHNASMNNWVEINRVGNY